MSETQEQATEQTAEHPDEPEPGPLTQLQEQVRALFSFDQLSEIRLALSARLEDLKKHEKKGTELGVSEPDTRYRLEILKATSETFGLLRIFAPEQLSETRDLFFDREKPNGRPDPREKEDEALAREVGAALDAAGVVEPAA